MRPALAIPESLAGQTGIHCRANRNEVPGKPEYADGRSGMSSRPDRNDGGLAARLLELGEELRREGVAVGTSELLDAFAVLREIEWTSAARLP